MATMGLRRRVQVSTGSSGQSSSAAGKRTRSENNNSPSQGNLNSPGSEPASKKPRGSAASSTRAAAKAKELDLKKMASAGPPLWSDPRPYASIAGLSIEAQRALCSEGLPSPMYMSQAMATFVGNATNLGKSPAVSYLDISNMTARPPAGWPGSGDEAAKNPIGLAFGAAGAAAAAALAASAPFTATSATTLPAARASPLPLTESAAASSAAQLPPLPKNFPNDSMFNAYQPWVIKTYGDLAKTKTITIKKYARILRTLRGEEVNSAENSKFRFWVKSKGFHIGQPEGYEPKPADRIIGRHAVTNPGLDPPLYVPTQPPHNKTLNGAESTVAPGRVYKKVAIVENFFDIIHAVHVDLEGRPGKHAGQKRTYRTITETYAFLPREAVTRFLLGCTECQRRPRTPSPTSLTATPKPDTPTTSRTPTPTATTPLGSPPSPKAATTLSSCASPTPEDSERPREASNPPESKNPQEESPEQPIGGEATAAVSTSATTTAATAAAATSTASIESNAPNDTSSSCKSKIKDERYNPLSITNLLRKDPVTRRPPPPTITTTLPLISAPETLTTTSICCASTVETCSSPSIVQAQNSRLLPETCVRRSTPSPSRPASQPRSWSPATEPIKSAPIDYSVTTVVPAQLAKAEPSHRQPRLPEESAEEPKSKKVNVEPVAQKEAELPKTEPRSNSSSESENETEAAAAAAAEERDFSPAAGLIGQNLNLLATIQQLHCQVMLALTERLRPAASASPVVAAATAAAAAAAAASAVSPASASRGAEAGDS